ncbi:helix-turn-helix domain-containing protein [Phyllobacterium myrsinacearum]|uniref:Transcriptional regulator with XRE-family HTH domain n=1 Tax=Phyllobacterium myrsinacearum TaxID=28101 RepID=A0A839EJK8_9HYPH|nr:helix-turn-helix domain-containing protein [Phyllobacterium myrsinacearum]MBA8880181.1 transcriptional regulator with XRE-family HTH domain [Phyllobacterium myrsinacearum]
MSTTVGDYSLPEAISTAIANGTNIVRAFREQFGYSVEDLAVACGLTSLEIDTIESGQNSDPTKLERIAHALGLPANAMTPEVSKRLSA